MYLCGFYTIGKTEMLFYRQSSSKNLLPVLWEQWSVSEWFCLSGLCSGSGAAGLPAGNRPVSSSRLHAEEGGAPSIISTGHHCFIVGAAADAEVTDEERSGIVIKKHAEVIISWTHILWHQTATRDGNRSHGKEGKAGFTRAFHRSAGESLWACTVGSSQVHHHHRHQPCQKHCARF